MSLHSAIHARWAASPLLTAIIPSSRFFTGTAPKLPSGEPQPLPFATLNIPGYPRTSRTTNAGRQKPYTVEIRFWTRTPTEGHRIQKIVDNLFENWSTELAGDHGTLEQMASGPFNQMKEPDTIGPETIHQNSIDYTAYVAIDHPTAELPSSSSSGAT